MILEAVMVKRSALIEAIEEDFQERLPGYHKSRATKGWRRWQE